MKLFSLLLLLSSYAHSGDITPKISPLGPVESAEQIQVTFSEPMIEVGAHSDLIPVISTCLKDGSGYWTDEKTWVYSFQNPPAPNTLCKVSTAEGLKSRVNQKSVKALSAEFKTLNAQIVASLPGLYETIDARQFFVLKLNGVPDPEWIKQNVYFRVKGLGENIPAEVLGEKEKARALEAAKVADPDWFETNKPEFTLVIRTGRVFPRGQQVELHWLKDYNFQVSPAFKATFSCERESAQAACVPLSAMTLNFSAEVPGDLVKNVFLADSNGNKIFAKESLKLNPKDKFSYLSFPGPFKARQKYKLEVQNIKSTEGEKLSNLQAFPLSVATADLPSLLKIDRAYSVLESSNPVLPLTMRSVETPLPALKGNKMVLTSASAPQIIQLIKAVEKADPARPMENIPGFKPFEFKVQKTLAKDTTEIVGIPLPNKGLHFHEFKSRILGGKLNDEAFTNPDYYVRSLALVTNIGLTLKYSPRDVMVWAVSLDKAQPLKNVKVSLYSEAGLKIKEIVTDEKGLAYAELSADEAKGLRKGPRWHHHGFDFYAFARKDDDFSLVSSNDNQGFEKYRFGISLPDEDPELIYHAILEKNLLRPGETVKAKLVYRKLEPTGLSIPATPPPAALQIKNEITQKKFKIKVKWDKSNGTGLVDWKIPEGATLGSYSIAYPDVKDESSEKVFGNFSVEEFKTPGLSAQMNAKDAPWINEKNPGVSFGARYFNGGPAAGLPVKIRYSLSPEQVSVSNEDLEGYTWQTGGVTEGLTKHDNQTREGRQPKTNELDLKTDTYGNLNFSLSDLTYTNGPQRAVVAAEYKDANGDVQTLTRAYPLYSSQSLIGLRAKSWYQTNEAFDFEAALVDLKNRPLVNRTITLTAYKVDNYSTRKKLLGGFYSFESFEEVKKAKDLCKVQTDEKGRASCHTSDKSLGGEYVVVASSRDEKGVLIQSRLSAYVESDESYWYGGNNSDRMDLIPFKKSYEPGETAEFQVRGPISEGQMLVTVERGKILSRFVQAFSAADPTIKFRIEDNWSPDIVVSAILVRGRVDAKVTGLLDLGKPSLKMGMAQLKVGLKKHVLNVQVKINKEIFQPREDITADVTVTDSEGKKVNAEIAVAAVDEALLALRNNNTWNLVESLLPQRAHGVETADLMADVLGKRTLGLKAVPAGGDGAGAVTRELFDTSLFWNPKVKVTNGNAKVKFKANDSLTAFRVVAVAMAGTDQFGTGSSTLKVTKDIQSFSSLALAVRKKDSYFARFNVRNSTNKDANLKAVLTLNQNALSEKDFSLKAGETTELSWPVMAPAQGKQDFELKITQHGKTADVLKVSQEVQDVWPLRSFGSSFSQTEMSVPVTVTPGATKNIAQITAIPSLASEIPGIKKFWELYPFDCFEQRLSKAVSLNSTALFDQLMNNADLYTDAGGLIKFYPQSRTGSLFLTNYALQISRQKNWQLPPGIEKKALSALQKYFDGIYVTDEYFDKEYRELVRLETYDTLAQYRATKPGQFETLKFIPEMLANNYLSHLISALRNDSSVPNRESLLNQTLQVIRSRSVLTSGRLSLKDTLGSGYSFLYVDEDTSFAKVLNQILRTPEFKEDGGRLILSFMEMMKSGSWHNTMANAWGVVALQTYKENFEKEKVNGSVTLGLGSEKKTASLSTRNAEQSFALTESTQLTGSFTGSGKPWFSGLVLSDAPLLQDRMHGITVEKIWTPVDVKDPGQKTYGDVWEIKLVIKSKSQFQWLAIRDPLPPGATVISDEGASFSEKKALEYRAYETWFDGNDHTYTYRVRLNQGGNFKLPGTRAEAMYDPDLNGEKLNGEIVVAP